MRYRRRRRKSRSRKTYKPRGRRVYVARRRRLISRTRRVGRGMLSSLKGGMIGSAFKGIGGGVVTEKILDNVAPQYSAIGGAVGAYAVGGPVGVVSHLARKMVEGGSVFGFGSTTSGGSEAV